LKIKTVRKETGGSIGEKFKEEENFNWQRISKAGNNLISEGARESILNHKIKKGVVNNFE